jgi:hypothetical protein
MEPREAKLKYCKFPGLYILPTIKDDNTSLGHAILRACKKDYPDKTTEEKKKLATEFRRIIADKLVEKNPITGKTHYSELFGGRIETMAKEISDYSLEQILSDLRNGEFLDHHLQELLSDNLQKDIYFISNSTQDVFVDNRDMYSLCYKGRNSIIIYHSGDHYEVLGIKKPGGGYYTVFLPDHEIIQYLNERLVEKIITEGV